MSDKSKAALIQVMNVFRFDRESFCVVFCRENSGVVQMTSNLPDKELAERCASMIRDRGGHVFSVVSAGVLIAALKLIKQKSSQDGLTTNSVSQSYSAPEQREPMRLIQDNDSHWYIIPAAKVDEFRLWCKAMEDCTAPPSDWEPERINGPHTLNIFDWEDGR